MLDNIRAIYRAGSSAAIVHKAVVAATVAIAELSILVFLPWLAAYSAYLLLAYFVVCVVTLSYLDKGARHACSDNRLHRKLVAYLILSALMLTVMLL